MSTEEDAERYRFFKQHPTLMVTNDSVLGLLYRAVVPGVYVGPWKDSYDEAIDAAREALADIKLS